LPAIGGPESTIRRTRQPLVPDVDGTDAAHVPGLARQAVVHPARDPGRRQVVARVGREEDHQAVGAHEDRRVVVVVAAEVALQLGPPVTRRVRRS
jgi:hypothetical protein